MKRRTQPKRLPPYREVGFSVSYSPAPNLSAAARARLLDGFIIDAVEGNGLIAGGGGEKSMSFFVTAAPRLPAIGPHHRMAIRSWLASNEHIASFRVGALRGVDR